MRFDGRVRGRFDPISRWGNRNRHPKSVGGNVYDPDRVSRADDGGVWSHDVVWKKHRMVSGE